MATGSAQALAHQGQLFGGEVTRTLVCLGGLWRHPVVGVFRAFLRRTLGQKCCSEDRPFVAVEWR